MYAKHEVTSWSLQFERRHPFKTADHHIAILTPTNNPRLSLACVGLRGAPSFAGFERWVELDRFGLCS
jgi:hypothetical protein